MGGLPTLFLLCFREIQPLETRAAGAGINVASNMLFTFVIGQCFTTMLCSMRYGVFLFFAGAQSSQTMHMQMLACHPCKCPLH